MSADLIDLIDQSRTTDVALEWTTSASSECSFGSVRLQSSWKESPSRYHKDVDIGPPNWLSANARFAVPHSLWFVRQLGFDDAKRKPKRNSEPTTRVRVLRLVTIAAGRFARNGWFSLGWPAAMDCVVVVVDSTIVDSQGDRRLLLSTERSDRQNPRRRVCVRARLCVFRKKMIGWQVGGARLVVYNNNGKWTSGRHGIKKAVKKKGLERQRNK